MPILQDFREKVELTLPVTKGKVWIYSCILAKDSLEIDKIYVSETSLSVEPGQTATKPISLRAIKYYEAQDTTLKAMVAKWDFTDKENKPLEPTPENIKQLPKQDFDYLMAEIDKKMGVKTLSVEQKKDVKKN